MGSFIFKNDGKIDYPRMMLANIIAIKKLGGSGVGKDILALVIQDFDVSDEEQSLEQSGEPNRTKLDFCLGEARQRLKYSGDLGVPEKRTIWPLTKAGSKISTLQDAEKAHDRYNEAMAIKRRIRS